LERSTPSVAQDVAAPDHAPHVVFGTGTADYEVHVVLDEHSSHDDLDVTPRPEESP
jgi:hypothetical protein